MLLVDLAKEKKRLLVDLLPPGVDLKLSVDGTPGLVTLLINFFNDNNINT